MDDEGEDEQREAETGERGRCWRRRPGQLELLPAAAAASVEYGDCNGGSLTYDPNVSTELKDDFSPEDDIDDDSSVCFRLKKELMSKKPRWCRDHDDWALYLFSPQNPFRMWCQGMISHRMFDHVVLVFIFLNCITIALERPGIDIDSKERVFLSVSNYVFTVIFLAEMAVKVIALGFCWGEQSYLQSSWNVLDGVLVFVSLVDILVSMASSRGNRILGILRVLRLLRTLRPLRVISRAPGLKLVVETLITSLRPIGNIVLICCAFFIVFGILGVQLFKGKFYICEGLDTRNITNKSDCGHAGYRWIRRKYNFDNLGQALMALFVLSCKDGWVNIMYDGLDAVGVDQQPVRNHNPWMLLYFISFLLIVSFFVLNMFVGVVVENFHKCRQDQEEEEARLREEKRLRTMEKKRRKAQQRPYYADYSPLRLYIHTLCTSHYLDLFITSIICINVVTMSMEHYNQPHYLEEVLKYCNYVFTCIFVVEALLKLVAFGLHRFFKDRWNQLDLAIVALSIMGITLEELKMNAALPINPTIIRIMRVLRIARVLKLLKMATGMRALLDTVMQALPQVGNLGLLFMLLFFIYAALGVELFGKLVCDDIANPCEGLSRHATFENFGMAFLTLFRVSTGDNWNGIMKDTLRECRPEDDKCLSYLPLVSPLYFVTFVLMAQFVLVNVVVAVLMKHLEESNKEAKEDAEMDAEIALEMEMERQRRLSTGSNSSSVGGTYVGPRPNSPGQEEEVQCTNPNLLSPRKMSVSRMHSLPNDSYMFQPVRPASAPYAVEELDLSTQHYNSGSVTSVHSQPCEIRTLLQVPGVSPLPSPRVPPPLPRIAPPTPSPSPRALHRQVAVKLDSVESQGCDQQQLLRDRPEPLPLSPPPLSSPLPLLLLPPPPSSPLSLPPPPASPHSLPRPASLRRPRPGPPAAVRDPADEEVSQITGSALSLSWGSGPAEEHGPGEAAGAKVCRSHSLSPYTSPFSFDYCPAPRLPLRPLPPPPSPTAPAAGGSLGLPEEHGAAFRRRPPAGASAPLPGYHDDQRRHSIEICSAPPPPQGDPRTPGPAAAGEKGRRAFPVRVQSVGGCHHRKKRLSPPCISIHPPAERDPPARPPAPSPPPPLSSDCSAILRRRALSSDPTRPAVARPLTPEHTGPPRAHPPLARTLTPEPYLRTCAQAHAATAHPLLSPASPNAFMQPRTPVLTGHSHFSPLAHGLSPPSQCSPLRGDYRPLPQFTFDQSEPVYMSSAGIPDTETAKCPSSPFDNRLDDRAGFSAKNRRTAQ